VGVHEWERREPQTVRVHLECGCDVRAAARDDDLTRAVDYSAVADAVLAHVQESRHVLIETMAEHIAALVRERFPVTWVRVRVEKPDAVPFAETVGVEIVRGAFPETTDR
jgi:dihydroneopterin aldolase